MYLNSVIPEIMVIEVGLKNLKWEKKRKIVIGCFLFIKNVKIKLVLAVLNEIQVTIL